MKYFKLEEFTKSNTAQKLKIDNSIKNDQIKYNIIKLVDAILDPLREKYGKPITISSGYRCTELNKAVGGSTISQHRYGQAADIQGSNTAETRKLYDLIISMKLPFDQIILEKGTMQNPQWVHVSYDESRNRRQKLYYNGKSYKSI